MFKVKNREQLLSNAQSPRDRRAREIALVVLERALDSVDPRRIVESKVALSDGLLRVDGRVFDLMSFKRVFIVGGGKASGSMAEALEEILGDRIEAGLIVVPHGMADKHKVKRITLHEAGHPVPDEGSVEGAKGLMEVVRQAGKDDLIICLISGGGSSLMTLPREGLTLEDKQRVTQLLLRSGASINEVNTVRKHLSAFKGGQLAKACSPATVLSLILSDVVGDSVDIIASGPTSPDPTTFNDAIRILGTYGLWKAVPPSVNSLLSQGAAGLIHETPKRGDPLFEKVSNIVIANNRMSCSAAVDELRREGLKTLFLTSLMEGEARDLGFMLGSLAREIVASGNPVGRPAGIVVGGETTVRVSGPGTGGRNQEVALGAALKIEGLDGVVVAAFSTDGVDGPTDAAGAIVDGSTIELAHRLGLDARAYLERNDSYSFFSRLKDLVLTGPTGTNVNDLSVLIVL